MDEAPKRLVIRVYGIVQGVGFRPFVSRAADRCGLHGTVCNMGPYVEIDLEGGEASLREFQRILKEEPPERSSILRIDTETREPTGATDFQIVESGKIRGEIFVSPDIATCRKCREELFDPNNRRYLHPFINCTACGPRLTILDSMPYDRERTSMGEFPMCPDCEYEYTHAETRRYDAQPVCCNKCGPELYLIGREERGAEALKTVREIIRGGGIAAIKGIGGFHLCCDATSESAVELLRTRKHRPFKPFAVMMRDLAAAQRECELLPGQEEILDGHQKPILLLRRRETGTLCQALAPGNPKVGVMLPYAPVQMLLFDYPDGKPMPDCLVMTSGNISGAPICRSDEDAVQELRGMCDVILSNNRKIRIRADDSVMDYFEGKPYMIRRSRGYAPLPIMLSRDFSGSVLAVGGELKNTFCISSGNLCYPSPYVGDMADIRTVNALKETVGRMAELLEVKPEVVACDLHPRYNTTEFANSLGLPVIPVQHHYAHIVSCTAENDYDGKVIGAAFDGTGYGTDGTIWGGEFLIADWNGFTRLGSIAPFRQAGGDASSREGWRIAVSLLSGLYDKPRALSLAAELGLCGENAAKLQYFLLEQNVNCVPSTSMGRMFDAVSALLGVKTASSFEGEAATALEFAAEPDASLPVGPELRDDGGLFRLDFGAVLRFLTEEKLRGTDVGFLAGGFHRAVAESVRMGCRVCREKTGLGVVALSGGCFQNQTLLAETCRLLREDGFRVLLHSMIPPNDGGIALGQAVAAMVQRQNS